MLLILALALVLLLALNAFFVLAEFAIVKVRPTRVAELVAAGEPRARLLAEIQRNLDGYLSVCQVGITLASVALGMVGERIAAILRGGAEPSVLRTALSVAASYVLVSGSHIVFGELVPKSIAIRVADRAALRCARTLHFFHRAFLPALVLFNWIANAILRAAKIHGGADKELHSEDELRIILNASQERGLLSFRRLLFMENVFDLGDLTVRDAMRPRQQVRCLDAARAWPENLEVARSARYTRYPLVAGDPERPVGFVHLKDLVIRAAGATPDLRGLARPILHVAETLPLEQLLAEMQRRRVHVALAIGPEGRWSGLVTLEDVIEELVGTIRDEFEDEEPLRLGDLLDTERIQLDVEGATPVEAVRAALERMRPESLPLPRAELLGAVESRERLVGTYVGEGIVMPHARIGGLARPFVMILRSSAGVACEGTLEKGHLLFVMLTPAGQPRVHQRVQSIIAILLQESEYVRERLMTAETPAEVLEVIRTGEQAVLA